MCVCVCLSNVSCANKYLPVWFETNLQHGSENPTLKSLGRTKGLLRVKRGGSFSSLTHEFSDISFFAKDAAGTHET